MNLFQLVEKFPSEYNLKIKPRPYFNHSVEFKDKFTIIERTEMLEKVGLNVFAFPAEMVTGCDLLSDSGTTSMTNKQWAALHLGDEAYGSNKGYFKLGEQIRGTFGEGFFNNLSEGISNAFIFHQGRAAENALFSLLGKTGSELIIPSNGHFDTTRANMEANSIEALNLFSSFLHDKTSSFCFKGNMDIIRLKKLLERKNSKVPLVYLTITNNTGGGQPVSIKNIQEATEISHSYGIPLFLDACRFAENAWFIKKYEPGYQNKDIKDIVREMFSWVDGFTISFKKDGLVNMGGGLFLKDKGLFIKNYPHFPDAITSHQINTEGHPTYGGLSGRDIMTLVEGLKQIIKEEYLTYRINQVRKFGEEMHRVGVPVLMPIGGHAIYLDVDKFFEDTQMRPEDFGGVALTAVLLAGFGHRACELGYFAFGRYDKKKHKDIFPSFNFVRFAVPRLRYEKQDLSSVAEAVKVLHEHRSKIPGVKVIYGRDLSLRHFKAKFEFKNNFSL